MPVSSQAVTHRDGATQILKISSIIQVVNTVLALERMISTKGLPPVSKKRLSHIPKSSFSKSTPFELYEDLTHPAPSLSHSSEMKLRSALNHIPMAELSLNDSPLPNSTTINPKYSRNKHHSELSYMTDMTPQSMRRKKSRSEIITDHASSRSIRQDRTQYRHVKDILFDMQGQPEPPYTGRRNSSQNVPQRDPLNFSSTLVQKANALTEAASQAFPTANKTTNEQDTPMASPKSPSDSGYGTNGRRRLSKQPSIPASFMSSSSDSTSTVTANNTQKQDSFNSTRSAHQPGHGAVKHGSTTSKQSLLENLHFTKKSSTRQKIPFHARYQEWSDQHKDKLTSSRVQHTLGYNDPMLDISGHDSYFTYEDELDEFGSMQSPNPFPSVSSPIPTVKDASEKTNVFKSGSVGKHKEERQSNPFYNKPSESKRITESGKERLCLLDDAGDLIAQYVSFLSFSIGRLSFRTRDATTDQSYGKSNWEIA